MWHRAVLLSLLLLPLFACDQGPGESTPASSEETATEPPAETQKSSQPPWFRDLSEEVGLDFRHETGATGELLLPEIMGSGAALFDAEGDGDLDLYLVNGALDLGGSPSETGPRNRLYLQRSDGGFDDATATSGLGDPGYGMGVAVGDVDNDGLPDVYVTNLGLDRLFHNRGSDAEGRPRFEDVTEALGTGVEGWSTSATFVDVDRDGYLDLYVVRYVEYDRSVRCYDTAGRHEYCGPTAYPGATDVLLCNLGPDADGRPRFRPWPGFDPPAAAGLGVVSEDFDGDGRLDIYIANDADPNQLWVERKGRLVDEALVLGASVNAMGAAEAGMGVLAADFDGDQDADLFMTHLENESNTLYLNRGADQGFSDATAGSGLDASSTAFTGFGTAALDVDLDGDLDLLVANGRVFRSTRLPGDLESPWDDYAEPNFFYRNDEFGDGGSFELVQGLADSFDRVEISRGLAVGDVDRDGDLDLLVSQTQGPARLLLNEAPREGHWLIVEAIDPRYRRPALGAVITVSAGGTSWRRALHSGSSYLSSHEPITHFGLGQTSQVDEIEIRWPDGLVEAFPRAEVDQRLRLLRGEGVAR